VIVFLRTIFRTLFGLAAVLAVAGAAAASAAPPGARRVVSLAPSLTELVYAAGVQRQLVGVSAYSDFPDASKRLPQIADASGISFEALLALKPDLVLAWKSGTRPADIARLASLGINTVEIDIATLADIPRAVRTIGRLVERAPGLRLRSKNCAKPETEKSRCGPSSRFRNCR
jgi:ABC-type hemin transport system substrate-binding protein